MCMTRYSRICLILSVLVSTHVYAQAASPSAPKLRYAPPALVNPQTILLGTGATTTTMDPTRDYIIQLPKEKKTGYTYLIGGRNIVLIGSCTNATGPTDRAATYLLATEAPNLCGMVFQLF
jgi:dihydropteroate synthase